MIARLALLAASLTGGTFTACEGGPVPAGCCEPGDQLDVLLEEVGDPLQRCLDMGGRLSDPEPPHICEDVDF